MLCRSKDCCPSKTCILSITCYNSQILKSYQDGKLLVNISHKDQMGLEINTYFVSESRMTQLILADNRISKREKANVRN